MIARPEHDTGKPVGALIAGLRVLHHLVQADGPMGVSQAARDLGISPSTCFNLLRTLYRERLVEFDPVKKTYSPGYGLLELAKGMLEKDYLVKFLRPRLERIATSHRVTGTLWRQLDQSRVILVERADTAAAARVHMTVGQRLPMFIGALGRCFAAYSGLPREEIRGRFDQLRWDNPPEFEEYWADVQQTREQGYAIDRDNFVRGITSVSAPLFGTAGGPATMAISAIGFSGQFTDASLAALANELCGNSRQIATSLSDGSAGGEDARSTRQSLHSLA